MFQKNKGSWLPGAIWRPKNPHSLDHLKFLYGVLCKNQIVTEQNRALLIETMRSISEILIWGDQNDSSVFDFFLEKNMLSFFLRFMRQKMGRHICVQMLQTLNILFDNISNETSVYYLLSNNHINSIIVHKFDFSDEEVMAYYISFLKTLSLKLNKHTIHFFYNERAFDRVSQPDLVFLGMSPMYEWDMEADWLSQAEEGQLATYHTNDFALYTEAIKFFNHSETMVRIAVRTITLNVYKVDDRSMLRYIRDKTAAPYFSNLVWFIGSHVLDLDICVRHDIDHNSKGRLADLVAEHLDHLHYVNDILCLNIDALNDVLTDHLLNRLLIPLYVYSLTKRKKYAPRLDDRPHVSSVVSLFLLSQVFLILSHVPLVRQLADIIFNGDASVCATASETSDSCSSPQPKRCFLKPVEPLAQTLENNRGGGKPVKRPNYRDTDDQSGQSPSGTIYYDEERKSAETEAVKSDTVVDSEEAKSSEVKPTDQPTLAELASGTLQNSTDEEKLMISGGSPLDQRQLDFTVADRPFLEAVFNALECSENDYEALFALCLLYALGHNTGINQELLDTVLMPTDKSENKSYYNVLLIEKLIRIISLSCQTGSKVRLATLEMSILLLKTLVYRDGCCFLQDRHLAALEGAREEGTLLLRNFYKSEEIFLDMFEDEYREMKECPLNVEYLTMDASILLPPTGTPLSGIDFKKRLPCGEVERARRAIRVFFHLRDLSLTLRQELETQLPLTKEEECVQLRDVLDLNNSDLIACTVISQNNRRERRFLVIDVLQLILVEPDMRKLGWGVVKFVGFLQDVEVTGDKEDSRSLHITIHKPSMNVHARPLPLLSARFIFDDHIRCMAAKQRLTKGRLKARQRKMQMIARLLELPSHIVDSMYQPPAHAQSAVALKAGRGGASPHTAIPGRSHRQAGHDQGRSRGRATIAGRPGSSRPVAIQQSPGGAIRAGQVQKQQPPRGLSDIEQAEEVTPMSDLHAAQSLNHAEKAGKPDPSVAQASSSKTSSKDIPLEDLSRKAKAVLSNATELFSSRRSAASESARARSSSYSPSRRGRRSNSGSPKPRAGSPATVGSAARIQSKSAVQGSRDRSGSCPIDPANQAVTSFSTDNTYQRGSTDSSAEQAIPKTPRPSKDLARSPPKSLTPAQEPRVSLVLACDPTPGLVAPGLSSPKLVPPTDQLRLRSDTGSAWSEADSTSTYTSSSVSDTEKVPPFKPLPVADNTRAVVGESNISADLSRLERATSSDGTASNQLTRLAQIVQEHYSNMADQPNALEMSNVDGDSATASGPPLPQPENVSSDDIKDDGSHSEK